MSTHVMTVQYKGEDIEVQVTVLPSDKSVGIMKPWCEEIIRVVSGQEFTGVEEDEILDLCNEQLANQL